MLLHHARRAARTDPAGMLVPLEAQDRSLWDPAMIHDGTTILMAALAEERPGEYQIMAAIAALHGDARSATETDWPQILAWYDDLVALTANPLAELSRAVAVGEVDGPLAGLRAVDAVAARLAGHHRLLAVQAHLHARAGDMHVAAELFAAAAGRATSSQERDHLLRRSAQARASVS